MYSGVISNMCSIPITTVICILVLRYKTQNIIFVNQIVMFFTDYVSANIVDT